MPRNPPHNRAQSLEKAMRLFWAKGYHATSMKDLEAALSLKPGSIYASFRSKDGLFRESLALYHTRQTEKLTRMLDASPTVLEGLADFLSAQVTATRKPDPDPACMALKTTLEMSNEPGEAGAEARGYLTGVTELIAAALRRAQSEREIAPEADANRCARRIQVKLIGLGVFLQKDSDPQVIDDLACDLRQEILAFAATPAQA